MRPVRLGAAVFAAFVAVGAHENPVDAQRPSATIVLESYEVRRPENADFSMWILREEFDKLGFVAKPLEVKRRLGNQLALPAVEPPAPDGPAPGSERQKGKPATRKARPPNPRSSAAALLKELSNVHERWLAAKESFDTLEPALSRAVYDAFASPALVVTDQSIRNKLQSVVLDLALINGKLAHDESREDDAKALQKAADDWMAEWIRTYGSEEITQKKNGPDADMLYTRVRDERDKLGRGVLSVTVDDPNVQLYVNETIRSLRHSVPDLSPGRYRALLMGPNDDARLFRPEVLPNQTTRLVVDWSVSSNLVVAEWSVGFVFSSATHLDPAALACKLARSIGDSGVVLIGLEPAGQSWSATASLYSVQSGELVRGGYTVLGADDMRRRLAALALFVSTGTHDPDVTVTGENRAALSELEPAARPATPAAEPAPKAESHRLGKWFAAGGATAAIALGGYGLYRYYTCGTVEDNCRNIYPRAGIVGYGASGAGIALGALAAYWFHQDANASGASGVTVAPSRLGAMIRWATEF